LSNRKGVTDFILGSATAATASGPRTTATSGGTTASRGSGASSATQGSSGSSTTSSSKSNAMATKAAYLPGLAMAVVGGLAAVV
jgi:hypothetical protein